MRDQNTLTTAQPGFSLVELLIAVSIFTVLMAMTALIFQSAQLTFWTAEARITSQQDLRQALGVMIRELAEASPSRIEITTPSEIVFQVPIRVTDGGALDGQMLDERNSLIWGARLRPSTNPDGVQDYAVQYALEPSNDQSDSSALVRRVLDAFPDGNQVGADMVVANHLASVEFTHSYFPPDYAVEETDPDAKKVTICHIPPGNPAKKHTITVNKNALNAHLRHGDYIGRCIGDETSQPDDERTLAITASAIKSNKFERDVIIQSKFGVTLRN